MILSWGLSNTTPDVYAFQIMRPKHQENVAINSGMELYDVVCRGGFRAMQLQLQT
jgi:hypothetical protein